MPESVAQSFLASVERQRSTDAVISPRGNWSYESLGRLAGSVATYLSALRLERGDRVTLLMANCAEYIGIYYGAQMSGHVTVPLNVQEPAPVLANLLDHCDSRVLFVDRGYRDRERLLELLAESSVQVVEVDRNEAEISAEWSAIRNTGIDDYQQYVVHTRASDLASIIYTSGTTGHPKGVMLSQRNLFANTAAILKYLELSWIDRGLSVLPFYYSFGNSILHTHMTAGSCLVMEDNVAFPKVILESIASHRATGFYGVPTTFGLLFGGDLAAQYELPSLRYVAQAGGPMSVEQTSELRQTLPHVQIFVMYGQTEATARLTYLPSAMLDSKIGSVGQPIDGVSLRLGHGDGSRGSAEEPLDVYVRGDNVMLGYWKDPVATAEVLRDGWLRTGDLGYLDEDDYLFLCGRSSEMIKTGANRVSPLEVEEVICGFDEVADAAVFAAADETLGEAIAVAIIVADGADLSERDVQRRCRSLLSPYKIPKYINFVDSLPRTSSGKIKRFELARKFEENRK